MALCLELSRLWDACLTSKNVNRYSQTVLTSVKAFPKEFRKSFSLEGTISKSPFGDGLHTFEILLFYVCLNHLRDRMTAQFLLVILRRMYQALFPPGRGDILSPLEEAFAENVVRAFGAGSQSNLKDMKKQIIGLMRSPPNKRYVEPGKAALAKAAEPKFGARFMSTRTLAWFLNGYLGGSFFELSQSDATDRVFLLCNFFASAANTPGRLAKPNWAESLLEPMRTSQIIVEICYFGVPEVIAPPKPTKIPDLPQLEIAASPEPAPPAKDSARNKPAPVVTEVKSAWGPSTNRTPGSIVSTPREGSRPLPVSSDSRDQPSEPDRAVMSSASDIGQSVQAAGDDKVAEIRRPADRIIEVAARPDLPGRTAVTSAIEAARGGTDPTPNTAINIDESLNRVAVYETHDTRDESRNATLSYSANPTEVAANSNDMVPSTTSVNAISLIKAYLNPVQDPVDGNSGIITAIRDLVVSDEANTAKLSVPSQSDSVSANRSTDHNDRILETVPAVEVSGAGSQNVTGLNDVGISYQSPIPVVAKQADRDKSSTDSAKAEKAKTVTLPQTDRTSGLQVSAPLQLQPSDRSRGRSPPRDSSSRKRSDSPVPAERSPQQRTQRSKPPTPVASAYISDSAIPTTAEVDSTSATYSRNDWRVSELTAKVASLMPPSSNPASSVPESYSGLYGRSDWKTEEEIEEVAPIEAVAEKYTRNDWRSSLPSVEAPPTIAAVAIEKPSAAVPAYTGASDLSGLYGRSEWKLSSPDEEPEGETKLSGLYGRSDWRVHVDSVQERQPVPAAPQTALSSMYGRTDWRATELTSASGMHVSSSCVPDVSPFLGEMVPQRDAANYSQPEYLSSPTKQSFTGTLGERNIFAGSLVAFSEAYRQPAFDLSAQPRSPSPKPPASPDKFPRMTPLVSEFFAPAGGLSNGQVPALFQSELKLPPLVKLMGDIAPTTPTSPQTGRNGLFNPNSPPTWQYLPEPPRSPSRQTPSPKHSPSPQPKPQDWRPLSPLIVDRAPRSPTAHTGGKRSSSRKKSPRKSPAHTQTALDGPAEPVKRGNTAITVDGVLVSSRIGTERGGESSNTATSRDTTGSVDRTRELVLNSLIKSGMSPERSQQVAAQLVTNDLDTLKKPLSPSSWSTPRDSLNQSMSKLETLVSRAEASVRDGAKLREIKAIMSEIRDLSSTR